MISKKSGNPDKIQGAGVIDVKGRSVESPQRVAESIRTLLKMVRRETPWLAPDGGFSQTVRGLTLGKLKSLLEGEQLIRRELAA